MDEAEKAEMRQMLAYAGFTGEIAVRMICIMLPELVARGALDPVEIETMHALLLHVEQSGMLSERDRERIATMRGGLAEDDPG
ncbi:MAG: hypothetical protein ACT6Q7_02715 [Blastomonas fulva]|uniref:hypothetical protein n=1 Tax=Blastomonas fulva TaxID=1550728 RepID=UPI0040348245